MAENDRVTSYLSRPGDPNARTNAAKGKTRRGRRTRPDFGGCKFGIELGQIIHLPSGQMKVTLFIPYEDKAEALKLTETAGLLLEASVKPVERIIR